MWNVLLEKLWKKSGKNRSGSGKNLPNDHRSPLFNWSSFSQQSINQSMEHTWSKVVQFLAMVLCWRARSASLSSFNFWMRRRNSFRFSISASSFPKSQSSSTMIISISFWCGPNDSSRMLVSFTARAFSISSNSLWKTKKKEERKRNLKKIAEKNREKKSKKVILPLQFVIFCLLLLHTGLLATKNHAWLNYSLHSDGCRNRMEEKRFQNKSIFK